MIMYALDLTVLKRVHRRLNQRKDKVSSIGTILKQRRKELGLKQWVVAYKICSVSHLSKIENNHTIPEDEILKLLLERLNLKIEDLSRPKDQPILDEILTSYFYDDTVTLERLVKESISQNDVTGQLLMCYYLAILKGDLVKTTELFEQLKEIHRSFSAQEFVIWILAIMSDSLLKHDYKSVIEYAYVLDYSTIHKRLYKAILHKTLFQAHAFLDHQPLAHLHANLLKQELYFFTHPDINQMLQLYERYLLSKTCAFSVETYLLKDDYRQFSPKYYNLHALIQVRIAHALNQPIPDVTPNQDYQDEWYYRLILFLSNHQGYDASQAFKTQNHFNAPYRSLYQLSFIKDTKERHDFIKENAMKMAYKHQEVAIVHDLVDESYHYLLNHSRYKEATACKAQHQKFTTLPTPL